MVTLEPAACSGMHYCEIESAPEFLSMGSYVKWWQEASILDIQELPFEILNLAGNSQPALAEAGENVLILSLKRAQCRVSTG